MNEKILRILTEIRPEFDFSQAVHFIDEGLLDSFDIFNLVVTLDKEFGISIDGMDIVSENFSSIEKISALLHKNGVKS
jgi:acyl carrier protein